jgi:hypothetical protein
VVSDTERGVAAVRDFVLKHASRFETDDSKQIPHNRAGWIRDGMYHFTSEAFKEACAGADPVKVKRALRECGLLHRSKGLNSNIRINGVATSVTSVLGSISSIGGCDPHSTTAVADTTSKNEVVSVVSQNQAATTDTTCKPKVVSAESLINKGVQPPIPPIPSKNSYPCSTPDFTDISTGNGEALLPQLEAKGVTVTDGYGEVLWNVHGNPTDQHRKFFHNHQRQLIEELRARGSGDMYLNNQPNEQQKG